MSFKLEVIELDKKSNSCASARAFNLTEKVIREWRKMKILLEKFW